MANILYTLIQPKIGNNHKNLLCYYEGMIKELKEAGNNILVFNLTDIQKITKEQSDIIKKFNLDIIFAFNNAILPEILAITNCKVLVFAEDSYVFFYQKELIKEYKDRYYFVSTDENLCDFKDYFDNKNMTKLHHATALQRENLIKDKNISFIGQPFEYGKLNQNMKKEGYNALMESYAKGNHDYFSLIDKHTNGDQWETSQIFGVFDNRVAILNTLLELGLNIYGVSWDKLSNYCNQLCLAFNEKPVYSLQDNQDIYNSSKININIQHPQNLGYGCAWRVYDIMASSGMLISQKSALLKEKTKNFVDIPMFDSPLEAADLCRKYLKEDHLREDIVTSCNEYIEKFGRWASNFKVITELTGIQIINKEKTGTVNFVEGRRILLKKYSRIKNIKNGYRLILSNLPVFEKLYSRKTLKKLYSSIKNNITIGDYE